MSCTDKHIGKNLKKYSDNRLSEEDAEIFEIHLFDCEKCSQELEILDTMRTINHEMESDSIDVSKPTQDPVTGTSKSFSLIQFPIRFLREQKLWVRIAASIIFFCVIGSAAFLYMGSVKYPPKGLWRIPYPRQLSDSELRQLDYPLGIWPDGVWVRYEFKETVMPGDIIKIVAKGQIDIAPETYIGRNDLNGPNYFEPDGGKCFPNAPQTVSSKNYVLRFPLFPDIETRGFASESDGFFCYALVGKFHETSQPFVIGKSKELTVTESIDGIYLAINDEYPADNEGYWEISIFRMENNREFRLL